MQMLAGTSGYSYKEWLGIFYPEKLPAKEMLRFYAGRFPTVEINNTFYRMPTESLIAGWAKEVPSSFKFTLKAPQRITHQKRLKEADRETGDFLRFSAPLADKLGMVLFQLPPFQRKDLQRLEDFLGLLPSDTPSAFEFRHDSWQDEEVYQALRKRNAALCVADTDEGDTPFVCTAETGYLRLRRTHYEDRELHAWVERIRAQPLQRAYVYFKHEDKGLGTKFAQRFAELWQKTT